MSADGRFVVFDASTGPGAGDDKVVQVPIGGGAPEVVSTGHRDERPRAHPRIPGWIAWQRRDRARPQETSIMTRSPSGVVTQVSDIGSEVTWWPD